MLSVEYQLHLSLKGSIKDFGYNVVSELYCLRGIVAENAFSDFVCVCNFNKFMCPM